MINRRSFCLMAVFVFLLTAYCLVPTARGQSATATLSGTVVDANGAVVPGVEITVTNPATALERTAKTNDSGDFTVPLLPPGAYTITARRDGFSPVKVPDVVLNVGDQKSLQVHLKAGDINAQVQITNDASLINESPAVATVIDRQFVSNLPLNGRSFQSLILLTPGVVIAATSSSEPGQFSVNGQRTNSNYFTVDGVGANIGVSSAPAGSTGFEVSQQQAGTVPGLTAFGGTNNLVSIDALEEFKIQTSSYSPEYGRQPGGQVQVVSRSGTNQFHGAVFDYLRNEAFDANDWFANSLGLKRAPLRQNQFGGTLSGPVILPRFGEGGKGYWSGKDKTFFFFSYEGQRLRLPININLFVPSLRYRQLASPALQDVMNAFALPTGPEITTNSGQLTGYAPLVANGSNPSKMDSLSIRLDHNLSNKATLFGRYNDTPSDSLIRSGSVLQGRVLRTRTLTLGTTYSFRQFSNSFLFNYSSNRGRNSTTMDDFGGAVPISQATLLSTYSGPGPTRAAVAFCFPGRCIGIGALGDSVDNYQRQMNFVDNLRLVRSAHTLKFGIDYRRLAPVFGPFAYGQTVLFFNENATASGLASLAALSSNEGARPIFNNFSVYAADTWKVSSRTTLDFGIRWEVNPAPKDPNGFKPILVTGINDNDVSNAMIAPSDAPFYKTFWTAFAPRFGIAHLISQKSGREAVFRGGFGIYYDLGSGSATAGFSGFPFSFNSIAIPGPIPFPLPSTLAVPPAPPSVTLPLDSPVFSPNPNLKLPYTLEWNVAIQQSLGTKQAVSISYVASAARRLLWNQNLNEPSPFTGLRPNPNFSTIAYITNGPTSDYQSLQVQFERRLSRGLQSQVAYTWAHAIDEASTDGTSTLQRGNADFDVRHNFSAAVTYNLPKLKGRNILAALVRDWSVDAIFKAQSGQPLNLTADSTVLSDGMRISVRPDVISGQPFWIKDVTIPGGQYLNPAAFTRPPVDASGVFLRQGTLGRNVVRWKPITALSMGVRRKFNLTERAYLQLRAEVFNPFNQPQFGPPDTGYLPVTLWSPGYPFGSIYQTQYQMLNKSLGGLGSLYQVGGPRSLQFSVRMGF